MMRCHSEGNGAARSFFLLSDGHMRHGMRRRSRDILSPKKIWCYLLLLCVLLCLFQGLTLDGKHGWQKTSGSCRSRCWLRIRDFQCMNYIHHAEESLAHLEVPANRK